MFSELKPMPDFVSTDNNVLTHVPARWSVRTMRSLIKARSERNRTDLPLLSVARERGVFVRAADGDNHNVIPDDLTNYKVARKGDLVINKMKAWQGSLGLAPEDGIVSPAYYVYDFAIENRHFGQALLRSKPYVAMLGAASDGVRIGQWDLSVARFRELPVVIPPADEQAAIVKYLAHAHARIDRAIAAKRKLIALLEEQKQAVIHQAVTRGLDSSVQLKDSDIPWLGAIPDHWQVRRAKYLFKEFDSRSGTGLERLLSLRAAAGLVFHDEVSDKHIGPESLAKYKKVRPGHLVMNRMRAASGLFAVASSDGLVSPDYSTMEVSKAADARFFLRLFKTRAAMAEFRHQSSGLGTGESGFMRLYSDGFGRISLPMPPLAEQEAIANELVALGQENNEIAIRVSKEIELLREFRTRLTSDVVTGQVDVRELAAALPEFTGEVLVAADDEFGDDGELVESELEFAGADE